MGTAFWAPLLTPQHRLRRGTWVSSLFCPESAVLFTDGGKGCGHCGDRRGHSEPRRAQPASVAPSRVNMRRTVCLITTHQARHAYSCALTFAYAVLLPQMLSSFGFHPQHYTRTELTGASPSSPQRNTWRKTQRLRPGLRSEHLLIPHH